MRVENNSPALAIGRGSRSAGWIGVLVLHIAVLLLFQVTDKQAGPPGETKFIEIFTVLDRKPEPVRPADPPPAKPPPRAIQALPPAKITPAPVQAIEEAQPITPLPAASDLSLPNAPRAPQDSDLMHDTRQIARKDDREFRKGKLAPLGAPYTPFGKMRAAMEGAHVGGSVSTSIYTSPDGVTITRVSRGGTSSCVMSGSVNGIPSAATGGTIGVMGGIRKVNCPPADAGWRRQ